MNRPLDDALRALPRREGRSDWSDLERRISALRPARPSRLRLIRRHPALSALVATVVLFGGVFAWRSQQSPSPEPQWVEAHESAAIAVAWADPWVAAAVETSR